MTRHVRRLWAPDELHELIEAAEAVEQMKSSRGWEALQRVLHAEIATIDGELDEGPAKEASDYAKQHGRRSALRAADEAARAIVGEAARQRAQREQAQRATEDAGESASERTAA